MRNNSKRHIGTHLTSNEEPKKQDDLDDFNKKVHHMKE